MRMMFIGMMIQIVGSVEMDPSSLQMVYYRNRTRGQIVKMATSTGEPVDYSFAINSLNTNLINHQLFLDVLTHFVRERIPERVVHAKGAGAFGFFEVTHDVTDVCKAEFLNKVGKRTPIAVRFSSTVAAGGGADTVSDGRGFAVKFYTRQGNFDIVGLNTPTFPIKDPIFFPSFIRAQKPNPVTRLQDQNMFWDFLTLHPETLYTFMRILGDPGIPLSYRLMPGFSIHTYQVVNNRDETRFVRFHYLPEGQIKYMNASQGAKVAGTNPDYLIKDLYDEIGRGNFPKWQVFWQVLNVTDAQNADFDIFDVTRILPKDKYPLRPIGYFTLNRNPKNYLADVEMLAFCPGNIVPGILGAPDKIFEARRFSYRDAQNYRLGTNFNKIPVNCPFRTEYGTYNRDGVPPANDNMNSVPNYFPNSFNGPCTNMDSTNTRLVELFQTLPYNYDQASELFTQLSEDAKDRLINNIVDSLKNAIPQIQSRAIKYYSMINTTLGNRIRQGIGTGQCIRLR